jgi:Domain of unknown function (DUF4198)
MLSLGCRSPRSAALARWASVVVLVAAGCLARIGPAHAFDLFATHEVTTQFATADGKPLANAAVRVFAPGDLTTPVETGRTDSQGKFSFDADRDGMWTAEARTSTEVARVMIRVGAGAPQKQERSHLPPYVVIGGLILLIVLAWWYLLLRRRSQRRRP